MKQAARGIGPDTLGCGELGAMGLVSTAGCCERCHSAAEYAFGNTLGPCRVTLPDGREAAVCCASKKHLLGRARP